MYVELCKSWLDFILRNYSFVKNLLFLRYDRKGTSDLLAWDPLFGPSLDSSSALLTSSSSGKYIYTSIFLNWGMQ